jgi:hypothetical protein
MFNINDMVNTAISTAVAQAVRPLVERIEDLEAANHLLAQRAAQETATPKPQTAGGYLDEYYLSKSYKEQFVEHLDCQEWFWGKVNDYVQEAMERYGATDSDGVKAVVKIALADERQELKQELFDELKEDLTSEIKEELESDLEDMVDRQVNDIDLDDHIRRALRNASISIDI